MKATRIEKDIYGNIRYEYRGAIIVRTVSSNAGHKTWDGQTTSSKPSFYIGKSKYHSIKDAVYVIDMAYARNNFWQLPKGFVPQVAGN